MKSSFSTNFDKGYILFNQPFTVKFDSHKLEININPPTVGELLNNIQYTMTLRVLSDDKFYSLNPRFTAANGLEMLLGVNKFPDPSLDVVDNIHKFFPDLVLTNNSLLIGDEKITSEEFNVLLSIVRVACGLMTFEEYDKEKVNLTTQESEFMKKQRELERKIKQVKDKALPITEERQSTVDLEKIVLAVCSYFPQYKMADLKDLYYYNLIKLYEYALKRQAQFVADVAAGNGLMKKNEYKSLF